jgi:phosphoesterase RecJ-like protein
LKAESARIRELVDARQRILVVSHKDADGDTLGSALAMADVLRGSGKDVAVRVPEPVPEVYSFLPGAEHINRDDGMPVELVMVMDASNMERLADVLGAVAEGVPIVNIDHHVSNTDFGNVNLVVPAASSTAEVTYDMLQEWGTRISPATATNLYTGILTDTGGFRHENTSFRALSIAAELVGLGADPAHIAGMIYKRQKITTLKLQALTMSTITFECDDRLVHAAVSQEMLRRAGARIEESEGLIDLLNSVEGLSVAILFKELGPELTKISIRTRDEADANVLAAVFGGGGHPRAAGAELQLPLAVAQERVIAEARRMLERLFD